MAGDGERELLNTWKTSLRYASCKGQMHPAADKLSNSRGGRSGCAHTHGQLSRHDEKLYPGVEIFNKRPRKTHVAKERKQRDGMGWCVSQVQVVRLS